MYRPFDDDWVQTIAVFSAKNAVPGDALKKIVREAIVWLENIGALKLCRLFGMGHKLTNLCGSNLAYKARTTNRSDMSLTTRWTRKGKSILSGIRLTLSNAFGIISSITESYKYFYSIFIYSSDK